MRADSAFGWCIEIARDQDECVRRHLGPPRDVASPILKIQRNSQRRTGHDHVARVPAPTGRTGGSIQVLQIQTAARHVERRLLPALGASLGVSMTVGFLRVECVQQWESRTALGTRRDGSPFKGPLRLAARQARRGSPRHAPSFDQRGNSRVARVWGKNENLVVGQVPAHLKRLVPAARLVSHISRRFLLIYLRDVFPLRYG